MIRSRRIVVGALAALGVVAAVPATAAGPASGADQRTGATAPARVSGPTPFGAGCNGPTPLTAAYVDSEVEPYVAVNPRDPRNLVAVYQADRYPNDGANGVLASVSSNGGRTWNVPALGEQPTFSRCAGGNSANGGDFEKASDPWVDFAPDGSAYFAAVTFDDSDAATAELVSRSEDGGRKWRPSTTLIRENDPHVIDDRPAVTADRTRPRNAYLVWARQVTAPESSAGGAVYFSRTTDGGATWSAARAIYRTPPGMETSADQIVELPGGDLLCTFNQLKAGAGSSHPRHDEILAIRSTDHGATWSAPITIATNDVNGVTDPLSGKPVRIGDSFTHVAVDPRPGTRNVYAVWGDARFTQGGAQQIALARSTDGGLTWSPPTLVSSGLSAPAFVPSVAVNAAGDVAVAYYQMTAGTPSSAPLATRYWIAISPNRGSTWPRRQQLTEHPFDLRTAPFNDGYFLGEYQGLAAAGREFIATPTLANGHSLDNRTDIYAAAIRP